MSKFKDNKGDVWKLRITCGTVLKVKKDTEINMSHFLNDDLKVAHEVLGDACKCVAVLFSILEEQADEKEITEVQFAERLYGDVFDDAKKALWDAYLDFCPSQQKAMLQQLMAKTEEAQQVLQRRVEAMTPEDLISFNKHLNKRESAASARLSSQLGS